MTRRKKVFAVLAGILLVFLVALNYLATMFIGSEWAKTRIQTIISNNFDGKVEYQSIELSILPFPHAEVHQINISIPEMARGSIQTFVITPDIFSLVKGNLLIEEIRLESPDFKIVVHPEHVESSKPKEALTSVEINNTIALMLSPMVGKMPGLNVLINNGKVDFVESDEDTVTLRDVYMELGCISDNVSIKMKCTSNLCNEISANAYFDKTNEMGNCEFRFSQLIPHALMDRFLSNSAFSFVKPVKELILRFKSEGLNDINVTLHGSSLDLVVDVSKFRAPSDYDNITYPLEINEWQVIYDGSKINIMNLCGTFGNSSFSGLNSDIWLEKYSRVEIQADSVSISPCETYQLITSSEKMSKVLKGINTVNGNLELTSLNLNGPLTMPEKWNIETAGAVEAFTVDADMFPEPIVLREGHFELADSKLFFTDTKVNVSDSSFIVHGSIDLNRTESVKVDIAFHGEIGHDSIHWAYNFFKLPPKYMVKAPLSLSQSNISWEKDSGLSLISNFTVQNSPEISVDMLFNPEGMIIISLLVKDNVSQASIKAGFTEKDVNFNFSGHLSQATVDRIFLVTPISTGWVKGDFLAHIPLDNPEYFETNGTFEGKDFSIPWNKDIPLTINSISLLGASKSIGVNSIMLTWNGESVSLKGHINTSEDGITFDMDMFISTLNWNMIRDTLGIGKKEKVVTINESGCDKSEPFWEYPINGMLRLHSECFTYEQFILNPLRADILFNRDNITVTVTDSDLCGFLIPGEFTVTPEFVLLDFQLLGRDQELSTLIDCMGDKKNLMTGNIDIDAGVTGLGSFEDIGKALQGDFKITAGNGRIYKSTLLSKLLAVLNFTEVFRGKIPDLTKKGCAYRSIATNGSIRDGTLIFDEFIMDGSSLGITGNGNIDLVNDKIDLNLRVSPLKTVDFIIKKIPVAGKAMGGTFVAIPVRVTGDTGNPDISYSASVSAIGNRLLNVKKSALRKASKIIRKNFKPKP